MRIPTITEIHLELGAVVRGRYYVDGQQSGRDLELFIGSTHIVLSLDRKLGYIAAAVGGWLIPIPPPYRHPVEALLGFVQVCLGCIDGYIV